MRLILLCLLVTSVSPVAKAGTCTGTEQEFAAVSQLVQRRDTAKAEELLSRLTTAHPDCPEILLMQARVQAAKGDQAAEAKFERYVAQSPEDPRGYAYLARFLIDQEEYRRADTVSAIAIDKGPSDPEALTVRGQILDMKGQNSEGQAMLEKACELDPDNADAQFHLAAIYDRAKRPSESVQHFKRVVAILPNNASAWDYLALNLEPLGDIDGADAAYQKALEANQPGPYFDAFIDYNYGRFLMKRNDLAASKRHLDRAVELVPRMRSPWYERAKLNLRLKNYEQARSDAEKAAALNDPNGFIIDLQIYALLEQIYRHLGEPELARKYADLSRETPVPARGEHR
jgi:tetratricopeptide (TPR) repeat protein